MHTLLLSDVDDADHLIVTGPERAHAVKVKRVREGERVRVLDGQGITLVCEVQFIAKELRLRVLERREDPPVRPAVHVYAPAPKGGRVSDMVDMLCQVGAASWTPVRTELSGPPISEAKMARMERIVDEALKQSLRPWRMAIHETASFDEAIAAPPGELVVVGQQDGDRPGAGVLQGVESIRLIIGPEGGLTADELARARDQGAMFRNFGPHVMRIEVAAPTAVALLLGEVPPAQPTSP